MLPLKILEQDLKKGFIRLKIDNLDDLYWLLSILEPGDLITMRTTRRIKQEGIRADSGERVPMTLTLEVEKAKIDQYSERLRVTGIVRVGPEKFGIQGQHHTLNVTEGSIIKIEKRKWNKLHLDILKRAEEYSKKGNVILVAMDDEGATVAKLDAYRAEEIAYVRSNLPPKGDDVRRREDSERRYYSDLSSLLNELNSRVNPEAIIIGGPGYIKDKFLSYVKEKKPKISEKMRLGGASSSTFSGILEMIKRGDVEKVAKEFTLARDMESVERIFELLAKNSRLVAYGLNEVRKAVEYGAAEEILIVSSLLFNPKTREEILQLMKKCEKTRAKFHIIDAKSEPGEKLASLGGIAARLRFQLSG